MPLKRPERLTRKRWPESGYCSCLVASPPTAPQCAVVTNMWSSFGPRKSDNNSYPKANYLPPKQHEVIFKAVGNMIWKSTSPAALKRTMREFPQLMLIRSQYITDKFVPTERSRCTLDCQRKDHRNRFFPETLFPGHWRKGGGCSAVHRCNHRQKFCSPRSP